MARNARSSATVALLILVSLSCLATATRAATVDVPIRLEEAVLEHSVAAALELEGDGTTQLRQDACNRVDLADLRVAAADGHVQTSVAVTAVVGAHVLGRCRGQGTWQGRMNVDMVPTVQADGLAVDFTAQSAELVRPDGSPGPLTAPTRMLAERLILPRLDRAQVDLEASLAAIDELLAELTPRDGPHLTDRTRIEALRVDAAGLEATLRLFVADAPVAPSPAAPEPALDAAELVAWQRIEDELDGFLTLVITSFAKQARAEELRIELLGVLLDARHRIAEALAADAPTRDPVRELFINSWDQLRPWLAELEPGNATGPEAGLRLAAFMAGGDAIRAIDRLGPQYGLEVTRDGLRRLARLLLAEDAPERFTPLPLEIDPALREVFGIAREPGAQARERQRSLLERLLERVVPAAHANPVAAAEALQGRVPRLATLDEYLALVATLLEGQTAHHLATQSKLPSRLVPRFDPLVRATAWKESCWRQFIGSSENPRVLTSVVGALGMMQINGRVWRGLYDLRRLAEEVDYNVTAGIEILEHYLVDYAIRRGEHEHPGGDDNLIRATYAAYNGGPSHLGRYRRDGIASSLRSIDEAFWQHYKESQTGPTPDVTSCYAVQR